MLLWLMLTVIFCFGTKINTSSAKIRFCTDYDIAYPCYSMIVSLCIHSPVRLWPRHWTSLKCPRGRDPVTGCQWHHMCRHLRRKSVFIGAYMVADTALNFSENCKAFRNKTSSFIECLSASLMHLKATADYWCTLLPVNRSYAGEVNI